MKRKIISLVLAVVFILGMVPVSVAADDAAATAPTSGKVNDKVSWEVKDNGKTLVFTKVADAEGKIAIAPLNGPNGTDPYHELTHDAIVYNTYEKTKKFFNSEKNKLEDGPEVDCSVQPWDAHEATITKIVVSEGITHIGRMAFNGCALVEEVQLPATLKYIGGFAFQDCVALKKINLPEGMTNQWQGIFKGCTSLETIVIPSTLDILTNGYVKNNPVDSYNLADQMFTGCTSLKYVFLPNYPTPEAYSSATKLHAMPFKGLEDQVTIICDEDSWAATYANSITLTPGKTDNASKKNNPFCGKEKAIKTITGNFDIVPEIAVVGGGTEFAPGTEFELSTKVDLVSGPAKVRINLEVGDKFSYVGNTPVAGVTSEVVSQAGGTIAVDLTVAAGTTLTAAEIAKIKVKSTYKLTAAGNITVSASAVVTEGTYTLAGPAHAGNTLTLTGGEIVIPAPSESLAKNGAVNSTVNWAVTKNEGTELSYTLTVSGTGAISPIDTWSVDNEASGYKIALDESTGKDIAQTPWKDYAYFISKVVIEEGITVIGWQSFSCLSALTDVEMADTVKAIGHKAFAFCEKLKNVELSSNLSGINQNTFENCVSLEFIRIPATLDILQASWTNGMGKSVANNMFKGCTALKYVYMPVTKKPTTKTHSTPFAGIENQVTIICAETSYAKTYAESVSTAEADIGKTVAMKCIDSANLVPITLTNNVTGKVNAGEQFEVVVKVVSAKAQDKAVIAVEYDAAVLELVNAKDMTTLNGVKKSDEAGVLVYEFTVGADNTLADADFLSVTFKAKETATKPTFISASAYGISTVAGMTFENDKSSANLLAAIKSAEVVDDTPTGGNDNATTQAPATTEAPEKKGCGGSIGAASVVMITVSVLGTAFVSKKSRKED